MTSKPGRSLSPPLGDYNNRTRIRSYRSRRAPPTRTIERELVGSYLKALMRQFGGLDLFLIFDPDIVNTIAFFANEMLVALHERIEMLRPSSHQYLQLLVDNEFLQIPIDCSKADRR